MPGFRHWWAAVGAIAGLLLAAVLMQLLEPVPPPVAGRAMVVDGDTLRVGGDRIRLVGLDAPELEQTCRGADGGEWRCGTAARTLVIRLVGAGAVSCAPTGRDRYDRVLARCSSGGADIGRQVVRAGLAVAYGDYFAEEAEARRARAGMWAGSFTPPAEWRRERQGEAEPSPFDVVRSWFR